MTIARRSSGGFSRERNLVLGTSHSCQYPTPRSTRYKGLTDGGKALSFLQRLPLRQFGCLHAAHGHFLRLGGRSGFEVMDGTHCLLIGVVVAAITLEDG